MDSCSDSEYSYDDNEASYDDSEDSSCCPNCGGETAECDCCDECGLACGLCACICEECGVDVEDCNCGLDDSDCDSDGSNNKFMINIDRPLCNTTTTSSDLKQKILLATSLAEIERIVNNFVIGV